MKPATNQLVAVILLRRDPLDKRLSVTAEPEIRGVSVARAFSDLREARWYARQVADELGLLMIDKTAGERVE